MCLGGTLLFLGRIQNKIRGVGGGGGWLNKNVMFSSRFMLFPAYLEEI